MRFGGGAFCLVGLAIMLIPVLDPRDDAFPAGRPAVFVAGLVFLLAGAAVLIPELTRGRDAPLAQAVVVAGLLSAFAAVPALIALHDGALPALASAVVVGVLALAAWDQVLKRWIPRAVVRLSLYVALVLGSAVVARFQTARGEKPAEAPAEAPADRPDLEER